MKFLSLILSLSMIFSLAGCSERDLSKGNNPDDPAFPKKEESVEEPSVSAPSEPLNDGQKEALDESSEEAEEEEKEDLMHDPLPLTVDAALLNTLEHKQIPWGFGPHFNADKRSQSCEWLMDKYGDKNALFIAPKEDVIYLTMDEGYENGFTPGILDTLKEKDVKATFFITGAYFDSQKELIQRMIDEGHTVGSHSTDHIDFAKEPIEKCYADLKNLHEKVRDEFNYEMRYFRFPGGSFSDRSLEMVKEMGYTSVFWSFAYKDWNANDQMPPDKALAHLVDGLHPGEILLLHPVGSTNAEILGDLIDAIRAKGFEIKVLPR